MDQFKYTFGAVRGIQNDRPFYQATVPFRVIASMLKLDDDWDVNKRSQRLIEKNRAKAVAKYLVKNKDGFWVLPPLVGFIEGEFEYEQFDVDGWGDIGRIKAAIDSRIMLFDGQHRAFGIREALSLEPVLGQQNISVMFFKGLTLSERQQAFHDINFTQKTPAAALCIAYNERDEMDKLTAEVFSGSNLRHLIEYEKNTVSGQSQKVYSLKTLKDFTTNAVGKVFGETTEQDLSDLVSVMFDKINIPAHIHYIEIEQKPFAKHGATPYPAYRSSYILGHAVTLKALGLLGKYLLENHRDNMDEVLEPLANRSIFTRGHANWENRCVNNLDKMVANQTAVRLTYYKLKELCGIELTEEELDDEKSFFSQLEVA